MTRGGARPARGPQPAAAPLSISVGGLAGAWRPEGRVAPPVGRRRRNGTAPAGRSSRRAAAAADRRRAAPPAAACRAPTTTNPPPASVAVAKARSDRSREASRRSFSATAARAASQPSSPHRNRPWPASSESTVALLPAAVAYKEVDLAAAPPARCDCSSMPLRPAPVHH